MPRTRTPTLLDAARAVELPSASPVVREQPVAVARAATGLARAHASLADAAASDGLAGWVLSRSRARPLPVCVWSMMSCVPSVFLLLLVCVLV